MKKIALIEFHFDFFLPMVEELCQNDLEVVLWTTHDKTLSKLSSTIFKYPSRFAQVGCTPNGEKITGIPDEIIVNNLLKKKKMIINQSYRFDIFSSWTDEEIWRQVLSIAYYWDTIIIEKEIDIFLYKTEPHMFFDFILYIVARVRNKINIFFERLPFDTRIIVCESLENMREETQSRLDYTNIEIDSSTQSEHSEPVVNEQPFHFKYKRERAKNKYKNIATKINTGEVTQKKSRSKVIQKLNVIQDMLKNRRRQYQIDKNIWDALRKNNSSLKKTWLAYLAGRTTRYIQNIIIYKNILKFCNSILFKGKFSKGGILFCLQCQPERSSNPCGGEEYHDQVTLISDISNLLGTNGKIYVKEHPSQYSSYQFPEKGRSLVFYRRLLKLKNVVLLPPFPTAEGLIKSASCVISLGGSAGWAALKNGVPAIICGQNGYAACESAMPGRNIDELKDSLKLINNQKPPVREIANSAIYFQRLCKDISEKAYLDNIYQNKFEPNFNNSQVLSKLVKNYITNKYSSHQFVKSSLG